MLININIYDYVPVGSGTYIKSADYAFTDGAANTGSGSLDEDTWVFEIDGDYGDSFTITFTNIVYSTATGKECCDGLSEKEVTYDVPCGIQEETTQEVTPLAITLADCCTSESKSYSVLKYCGDGTIAIDGTDIDYTAAAGFIGEESFIIEVCCDGTSHRVVVTVDVTAAP